MKVARYIVVVGLLAICFGILARFFYLDWHYYRHAPRQADVLRGVVYPAVVYHGTTVYLTVDQWRWFGSPVGTTAFGALFVLSAAGAYSLNRRWKILTS